MATFRRKIRPSAVTRISPVSSDTRPPPAALQAARSPRRNTRQGNGKFLFDLLLANHGYGKAAVRSLPRRSTSSAERRYPRIVAIPRSPTAASYAGTSRRSARTLPHRTDGAHAHPVEIRSRLGRISLEVAVECAVLLSDRKLVAGAGKVVHPDVEIPGPEKSFKSRPEDAEFFSALGQVSLKCSLLLAKPRHVRVAEHRHTVGLEREHLIDRCLKALGRLKGRP